MPIPIKTEQFDFDGKTYEIRATFENEEYRVRIFHNGVSVKRDDDEILYTAQRDIASDLETALPIGTVDELIRHAKEHFLEDQLHQRNKNLYSEE